MPRSSSLMGCLSGSENRDPFAVFALLAERDRANAWSARRDDRVGERGRYRRGGRLADARGRLVAVHDVEGDLRRLVDAQDRVVVEGVLLDGSVLDRDLAEEGVAQAIDDAPFHLRP